MKTNNENKMKKAIKFQTKNPASILFIFLGVFIFYSCNNSKSDYSLSENLINSIKAELKFDSINVLNDSSLQYFNVIGEFSKDFCLKSDTIIISKSGKRFECKTTVGEVLNDTIVISIKSKSNYIAHQEKASSFTLRIGDKELVNKKGKTKYGSDFNSFKNDEIVILTHKKIKIEK